MESFEKIKTVLRNLHEHPCPVCLILYLKLYPDAFSVSIISMDAYIHPI